MSKTVRVKDIKLRKERKCFACRKLMNSGDTAHQTVQVDAGKMANFYMCTACETRWKNECTADDELSEGTYELLD